MESHLKKGMIISLFVAMLFGSCKKEKPVTNSTVYPSSRGNNNNPPPPVVVCDGSRPVINATLTPVGSLSLARIEIVAASSGDKILFIGGMHAGQNWWNEAVPADIYDISNDTWNVHWLVPDNPQFTHFRFGAAIASVGNKILFAGGGDGMGDNQTSRVDIYNVSSGSWSVASLSSARQGVVAATIGDKVLFAGGFGYPDGGNWGMFSTVDIYDNSNNSWSTSNLSHARMDITATTVGNKIYFAGGRDEMGASTTIDIYDATTGSWSVSSLQQPRTDMASIATDRKIFWAGGHTLNGTGWSNSDNAEILDLNTGGTSHTCILPRSVFNAVKKDEYIIFFTGYNGGQGDQFEIYNTVTDKWSTGMLNQKIQGATVISVNNKIFVAGGLVNGTYSSQVWKLDF